MCIYNMYYISVYMYMYIIYIDTYIYVYIYMRIFVPLKKLLRRSLPSPTHMNPSLDNDMAMQCHPWIVAKAALRNALHTIHTALMPSQGKVTIA